MAEVPVINLWTGCMEVFCGGCGEEIADEGWFVWADDRGQPTTEETGAGRATCKAFHDRLHGIASDAVCPLAKVAELRRDPQ